MKHWPARFLGIVICWMLIPIRCPAPLIYVPGEGWHYEQVGEGKWQRKNAKLQLEVAQSAFDAKDYNLALRAARRTIAVWSTADYAPQAQYLIARCYEAKGDDQKAFKAYQRLLERYPKFDKFDEIIQHQFAIASRYLAGQHFKLWGIVPWFRSMPKTIEMYEQIVKNGRYSDMAPQAQLNIGAAHEKKKVFCFTAPDYDLAAKAYEVAADRYNDKPIGVDALFKEGQAYTRQAKTAEYDQSVAGQAIATFNDFMTLYPNDSRISQAEQTIKSLKTEQARGSFDIARFYERSHRWQSAMIYYNAVLLKDPTSKYADEARLRMDVIKRRTVSN